MYRVLTCFFGVSGRPVDLLCPFSRSTTSRLRSEGRHRQRHPPRECSISLPAPMRYVPRVRSVIHSLQGREGSLGHGCFLIPSTHLFVGFILIQECGVSLKHGLVCDYLLCGDRNTQNSASDRSEGGRGDEINSEGRSVKVQFPWSFANIWNKIWMDSKNDKTGFVSHIFLFPFISLSRVPLSNICVQSFVYLFVYHCRFVNFTRLRVLSLPKTGRDWGRRVASGSD